MAEDADYSARRKITTRGAATFVWWTFTDEEPGHGVTYTTSRPATPVYIELDTPDYDTDESENTQVNE